MLKKFLVLAPRVETLSLSSAFFRELGVSGASVAQGDNKWSAAAIDSPRSSLV